MTDWEPTAVAVELSAVIIAVADEQPRVLVRHVPEGGAPRREDALPAGPFDAGVHRTLERGLRSWVAEQTGATLGYVEQLYTFGDRDRHPLERERGRRVVSVGYLALTGTPEQVAFPGTVWDDCYRYFPWEDWRQGRPPMLATRLEPLLRRWSRDSRRHFERAAVCFGLNGIPWDEEKVLERYELLYEAGLVREAVRDRAEASVPAARLTEDTFGTLMRYDHRRILATALGRVRGKLKYRPVVFELLPETFTLNQLQRTVEAIAGRKLHTQNFRRLVEKNRLVEGTGKRVSGTGGRPAEQFQFRHEVLQERPAPGLRLSPLRDV